MGAEEKDPFFEEKPTGMKEPVPSVNLKSPPNEFQESFDNFQQQIWLNLPPQIISAILKVKSIHKETGEKLEKVAQVVDGFTVWEHFASSALVLMTALSTWFITYFRLGFGYWFLSLWYLSYLYTKTIQRLRYKTKNQALKEHLLAVLDNDKEYVEWFNQFLSRFWMNYEPQLSAGLKDSIGATLDTIKAPGIDEIVLSKFTLGSQAPRIDAIKTFTNTGEDILILDFDLSFTPFDSDSVSKKERLRKELRNLEIVLQVKVAMMPLPVSLKELYINGCLRLQFTFMSAWPHIKLLDLGFVKKPELDFVLKPLGTDLSKIAGLGSFIKDTVDSQLAGIIVNPVKMTIPIGEWWGDSTGKTEVPVGVLRVAIYEAKGLKNVDVTGISDPAAIVSIGGNEVARTRVFDNCLDPKWSEVHHIVVYQSMLEPGVSKADEFRVEVVHVNAISNSSLGVTSILSLSKWIGLLGGSEENKLTPGEVEELIHDWGSPFETNGNIWKKIHYEKKRFGSIRLDLSYFPILKAPPVPANPSTGPDPLEGIVAGVVTVSIHQAKEVNIGHISCAGKIDGVEIFRSPIRKRTVNPAWNTNHSFYCANIAKTNILFTIMNKNNENGHCDLNVLKTSKSVDDWYKIAGGPGKLRVTVKFQPLDILHSTVDPSKVVKVNPMGVFRIKVTEARDLYVSNTDKATLGLAKNDPYCKVFLHGRAVGVTSTQEKNNLPKWHDTFYTFSYSMKEFLTLDVYDSQNLSKDRPIGKSELQLAVLFDLADGKKVKNLPPELESVKVVRKGNYLEVWAPLFIREDSKLMETLKGSAEDLTRISTNSAAKIGIRSNSIPAPEDTQQVIEPKLKAKGQIRIEIELYPTVQSAILDFTSAKLNNDKAPPLLDAKPNDITIMETEPSPDKTAPNVSEGQKKETVLVAPTAVKGGTTVTVTPKSPKDVLAVYKSGVLRLRANHAILHEKKSKIYLEIYFGQSLLHSTFASTLSSSMQGFWFSSSDHFVLDMSSAQVSLLLKEQNDPKRSSKDAVLGYWSGDFISLIAKGPLNLKMREHSQTTQAPRTSRTSQTEFEELVHTATIELSASFFPAVLTNTVIEGNTGLLHLDILNAKNLTAVDSNGLSDPYVLVNLNGKNVLKTKIQKKTLNPVFDEGVQIEVHSRIKSTIFLEVKDYNQFSSDVALGFVTFSLANLKLENVTSVEMPLEGSNGTVAIRYLFEEAVLERQHKDENDKKLLTETSTLGKLGKGLTHQVTGLGSMFGSVLTAPLKEKKLRKTFTVDKPSAEKPTTETPSSLTDLSNNGVVADKSLGIKPVSRSRESIGKSLEVLDTSKATVDAHNRAESASPHPVPIPHDSDCVEVQIVEAKDLKAADGGGTSDPFVRVTFQGVQQDNKKVHKTAVIKKNLNPVWDNEKFVVPLNGNAIKLSIMDKNLLSYDTPIGHIILDVPTIMSSKDLTDEFYRVQSGSGTLRVIMRKVPASSLTAREGGASLDSPGRKSITLESIGRAGSSTSARRSVLSSLKKH